jgi:amino acid transporter
MNVKNFLLGKSLDPFKPGLFKHVALVSLFAWIGLGADGLSSSCYGPEQAYLALGSHTSLAIFIAAGIVLSIFIIAFGYNQVLELFPSGGGGYRVATQLLGKEVGVVSGSALLVDYVLTIAISVASGMDALYSFFPLNWQVSKLPVEILCTLLLMFLNLRGMKESIKVLLPIFMGFVLSHLALIVYGISSHHTGFVSTTHQALQETSSLSLSMGPIVLMAFILHAYSLGSGTYTGLEAVSNNVNKLAEPRVHTGKMTMFYIAASLSVVAGGITLLYLLWNASPESGKTLNAVVFQNILGSSSWGVAGLIVTLLFEAGILLVGANTGFLAGPAVVANMAQDNWLPRRFRLLSSRLVTSNGILLFGICAIAVLLLSNGKVDWLVVLYSINVFITFTLTMLGLSVHWIRYRSTTQDWLRRFLIAGIGFLVTGSILIITILTKFTDGGWVSLIITFGVILFCYVVKHHYLKVRKILKTLQIDLAPPLKPMNKTYPECDPSGQTAIILVDGNKAIGMHTLYWIIRHFPNYFKNYIFVTVGQVDIKSFQGVHALKLMTKEVESNLDYFVKYCHQHHLASKSYSAYGPDVLEKLMEITETLRSEYPQHIFFAGQVSFLKDSWLKRMLHNGVAYTFQRRLHSMGEQIILLPMRLNF